MNKDVFTRHIEESRDCDRRLLDAAVSKGFRRAKNDAFDAKKPFRLAAACVFSALLCLAATSRPFQTAAEDYYRGRHETMPGSAKALGGYMENMAADFRKYIGG